MSIKRKLIIYFLDILVARFLPIREEFCIIEFQILAIKIKHFINS